MRCLFLLFTIKSMYNEEWWVRYQNEWGAETYDAHLELMTAAIGLLPHVTRGLVAHRLIDLGCGRTHRAHKLVWPAVYGYAGLDLDPRPIGHRPTKSILRRGDFENEDDIEKLMEDSCIQHDRVIVVSLHAVELYARDPNEIYARVLRDPRVLGVVSAGVRYPSTSWCRPVGERGSRIWQTCPEGPYNKWAETRLVRNVPSTMFGDDVVEVWRVIRRLSQSNAELKE